MGFASQKTGNKMYLKMFFRLSFVFVKFHVNILLEEALIAVCSGHGTRSFFGISVLFLGHLRGRLVGRWLTKFDITSDVGFLG